MKLCLFCFTLKSLFYTKAHTHKKGNYQLSASSHYAIPACPNSLTPLTFSLYSSLLCHRRERLPNFILKEEKHINLQPVFWLTTALCTLSQSTVHSHSYWQSRGSCITFVNLVCKSLSCKTGFSARTEVICIF